MAQQSHLPLLSRSDLDNQGKELHDYITTNIVPKYGKLVPCENENGDFIGLLATLLHVPAVGKLYLALNAAVTALASGISPKAREVAQNLIVAKRKAAYAMDAHERLGRAVGFTQEQLETIQRGEKPKGLDKEESVAWEVANALSYSGKPGPLENELWDRAVGVWGKAGAMGLVHLCGLYEYTSVFLNGFDVLRP